MEVQTKLLRVLDNGKFRRVGGREDLHSYFRLITATNEDLLPLMSLGKFRRDLYFRLASTTIIVPPLRDRREDILPMAEHCLQIFSHASGKTMVFCDCIRFDMPTQF